MVMSCVARSFDWHLSRKILHVLSWVLVRVSISPELIRSFYRMSWMSSDDSFGFGFSWAKSNSSSGNGWVLLIRMSPIKLDLCIGYYSSTRKVQPNINPERRSQQQIIIIIIIDTESHVTQLSLTHLWTIWSQALRLRAWTIASLTESWTPDKSCRTVLIQRRGGRPRGLRTSETSIASSSAWWVGDDRTSNK